MTRILAILSSAALLAASALAQCPQGTTATMTKWSSSAGYASTLDFDDEGITSPPIAITAFPNFPMAGAVGNLDQMWINTNGEIYLTDSTLALTQPVGGSLYGTNTLLEMRGNVAGGSARIVPLGGDHESSDVAGNIWEISVDQSTPGLVQVTWTDMARYANTTDKFSFHCHLYSTGIVAYFYGPTFPSPFTGRYVGISIGNLVGTTTSPNLDLSATPDSGVEGMMYQSFTGTAPNVWDLSNTSLTIIPNGLGGYTALPLGAYVSNGPCASNVNYGAGCYNIAGSANSLWEQFGTTPLLKAALDGNSMSFTRTPDGYVASWNAGGGASYVAPTGGATITTLGDDATLTITPGLPVPIPFGQASQVTIGSNGMLTLAGIGNNGTDYTPTTAELTNVAVAANTGFYTWMDFNAAEAGSGKIKYEQLGSVLYVTWDAVENYGTPAATPSTWQYQVDLSNGNVNIVWVSMSASTDADIGIVGCTLAGPGATPGAVTLSSMLPTALQADRPALKLTASARPRLVGAGTNMTYTVDNIPEYIPGSGIYIATMFLSLGSLPGVDLGFIGAPGCLAHIASLDVNLNVGPVPLFPSQTASFLYDSPTFAPGNVIYAQAIALFDPVLQTAYSATGNTFGLLTSTAVQHNIQIN